MAPRYYIFTALLLGYVMVSSAKFVNRPSFEIIADRLRSAINISADPCENFFEFACGGWKADNPVPPNDSKKTEKTIFGLKRDHIRNHLYDHFDSVDPSDSTMPRTVRQAKLFLDACQLNATTNDWKGIVDLLDSYGGWPAISNSWQDGRGWNRDALAGHIASHYHGGRPQDTNTAFWVAGINTGSLGIMPGPSPFSTPPQFSRSRFVEIATKIALLANMSVPQAQILADADQAEELSMRLASIFNQSDPRPTAIRRTIDEANARWPYVNWTLYFSELARDTLPELDDFRVYRPKYFDLLAGFYPTVEPRAAQNLLMFQIAIAAVYDNFAHANLKENRQPGGTEGIPLIPEPDPEDSIARDESVESKCRSLVGDTLEPAKFLLFAMNHAPNWDLAWPEAQRVMRDVLQAWHGMLRDTAWLTRGSRLAAWEKVRLVKFIRSGFDPRIFDEDFLLTLYGGLQLDASNNGRLMASLKYGRFKKWRMFNGHPTADFGFPLVVNAYYFPRQNAISLPAGGMLSEPYFEYGYPKATNYAGLGFAVGHEMGHGFDINGAYIDAHGQRSEWIEPSVAGFNQMQVCMVNEYNKHCYKQDSHTKCVDGAQTMGDNSADNSGIVAAYRAYKARIAEEGAEPRLPGSMGHFSMDQVFFLSYGYSWCRNTNSHWFDSSWRAQSHAPGDARTAIPNMNFGEFRQAFNCPVPSQMAPEQPCRVWH